MFSVTIVWFLKTKSVISSDPTLHVKKAMPDLQRYPWNLNLIKKIDNKIILNTRHVLNSDSLSEIPERKKNQIKNGFS